MPDISPPASVPTKVLDSFAAVTLIADVAAPLRPTYVSQQTARYGYAAEDWVAAPGLRLAAICRDDRASVVGYLLRNLQPNDHRRLDYRLRDAQGNDHWIREEVSVAQNDAGGWQVFSVLHDVTDLVLVKLLRGNNREEPGLGSGTSPHILQNIIDSMVDGLAVCDPSGNFLVHNQAAVDLVGSFQGLDPSEWSDICGLFLPDRVTLFPPDQLPLARALRGETCRKVEIFVRNAFRPEGTHISVTATPLVESDGTLSGAVAVFRDITAERRAQEALKESQTLFERLCEVSPVGIFRTDLTGSCTYVNQRGLDMAGLSLEEALADGWTGAIHPEDRPRVTDTWQQALEMREPLKTEFRFLHPSGTPSWVIGQAVPEYGSTGSFLGYVGTVTDMTSERRAQQDLRIVEHAMNRAADAIFWVKSDGSFLAVNDGACRSLGYSREELMRLRVSDIDIDVDRVEWEKRWKWLGEAGTCTFEDRHRRKDGSIYPAEISVSRCIVDGTSYNCAISRDLTERKLAQARIQEEQQSLARQLELQEEERRRACDVIHDDLVQHLFGVQCQLDSLAGEIEERGQAIPPQLSAAFAIMQQVNCSARRLMDYLRPMTLDDLGIVDALRGMFADAELCQSVDVQLALDVQFDRLDPRLETAIFRIVQEAVSNVAQHSGAACCLVRMRQKEERLCLEIRDEGCGFDTNDRPQRTTFGIVSMRRRAEAMSGTFDIASEPGRGTTVRVNLPVIRTQAPPEQ